MFDRLPVSVRRYESGLVLGSSEDWDRLREADPAYSAGASAGEWRRTVKAAGQVAARARALADVIRPLGVGSIASYGSGTCALEWHLKSLLDIQIVCADYAPRTVERMKSLFPEAEHVVHDLEAGDPIEAEMHLLHRIDSEFDDTRLASIVGRFRQPALVVAAEPTLTPRLWVTYKTRARRAGFYPVGWCRTTASLEGLWLTTHRPTRFELDGRYGWLLRPRDMAVTR